MRILVTGGAGFIGSNIVDKLVELNYEVIVIDNLLKGKKENLNPKVKFYELDICSEKVIEVIKKENIEIIYHLAAQIDIQKSIQTPSFDAAINILGTINILEGAKLARVSKIIYSSSAAVYGEPKYASIDEQHLTNPISYYGISKHTSEYYIKVYSELYDLDYTILRYANVYGIRQEPKGDGGVISIFSDKMLKNQSPSIFGDGMAKRDYIYVEDVVSSNIKALESGSREIVNVGTGFPTSVNELFNKMREIMKLQIEPIYKEERRGDIQNSYFIIEKAKEILNWKPQYSLDEGLLKTINYYKKISKYE